jgi:DNA-directed RNA polymerase subunit F
MTEEFLTLAEVKELLLKEQSERILTLEQNYTLEHATRYAKLSAKDSRKLVNDLMKNEQISEAIACKIVDLMPRYPAEVESIFLKERLTLEDNTSKEILEKVKQYL